jgi:putative ABC transport system ATP-binding protein
MSLIEIKNLQRVYFENTDIELRALRGVDLKIEAGEFVAIMGPSGSGKSTLMHLLGFLDTPSGGKYFFEGEDATNLTDNELATIRNQKVGFVFQSFHLLPRTTATENVELPLMYSKGKKDDHTQRAQTMLQRVGLGDRLDHMPNELSGGQQQRVSIARALVNNPRVIFADEPTGNLDSVSSKEIMDIFKELHKEGRTIIMVTHDPMVGMQTDRIISLQDGNIIRDEKTKDISDIHHS